VVCAEKLSWGKLSQFLQKFSPAVCYLSHECKCRPALAIPGSCCKHLNTSDLSHKLLWLKNFTIYEEVPVPYWKMSICLTLTLWSWTSPCSSHQTLLGTGLLILAKYLKVGPSIWGDWTFQMPKWMECIPSGRNCAYTEFWNQYFLGKPHDVSGSQIFSVIFGQAVYKNPVHH